MARARRVQRSKEVVVEQEDVTEIKEGISEDEKIEKGPKDKLSHYKSEGLPKTLSVEINDSNLTGELREFKTGSVGYYISGKITINSIKCQVSTNVIVVGSKDI